MLRDGYFIKEDPPRIGAHYVPQFFSRSYTPEERFMQDIILNQPAQKQNPFKLFLGRVLSI